MLLCCYQLCDQRLGERVVHDRQVFFQVWSVLFYSLLWSDVQILDHVRPASVFRQGGNITEQDSKCLQQDIERHNSKVFSWAEPCSGSRVVKDQ